MPAESDESQQTPPEVSPEVSQVAPQATSQVDKPSDLPSETGGTTEPASVPADLTPPRKKNRSKPAESEEGPKLIIEQVLFALMLAFIFRAFVLEAFVIPTGSMATTLLGAHMRFDCPDCGWQFTTNYDTRGGSTAIPRYARYEYRRAAGWASAPQTVGVHCPNCNYRLPRDLPGDEDNDATTPPVYAGDRILVLKHLYLFRDPERWDVVVFKSTNRSSETARNLSPTSTEPHQENVIKRLVGLPGESLMVLRGDVYTAPADLNVSRNELKPEHFEIRRKRDKAQDAVWRVVYNDDYRPRGLSRTYEDHGGTLTDPSFENP